MTNSRVRRPWHLWLFAFVILFLYAIGSIDFVRVLLGDTDYIAGLFGQTGVEYFRGYPVVLRVIWSVNVVTGSLAPVFLLVLSRWVGPLASVAAIAQAILLVATFSSLGRWEALGASSSLTDIGVGVLIAVGRPHW